MYAKDLPIATTAVGTEKMIGVQGDELKLYSPALFKGEPGKDGLKGLDGLNGEGVPTGGTINQVLSKVSSADFDTTWTDPATGGATVVVDPTAPTTPNVGDMWLDSDALSTAAWGSDGGYALNGTVTTTGAVASVSFTGLDSSIDGDYVLEYAFTGATASVSLLMYIADNGGAVDTTAANYFAQLMEAGNGSGSASKSTVASPMIGWAGSTSLRVWGRARVAVIGGYCHFDANYHRIDTTAPIYYTGQLCGGKNAAITKITTIQVQTSSGNIPTGAVFRLYKSTPVISTTSTSGGIVQTAYASSTTTQTITTGIPLDSTPPLNTEGDQVFSLTITPKSATSILHITGNIAGSANAAIRGIVTVFKDSDAVPLVVNMVYIGGGNWEVNIPIMYRMVAGTTSPITFKLRAGPTSNTFYVNGDPSTEFGGGLWSSYFMVEERLP